MNKKTEASRAVVDALKALMPKILLTEQEISQLQTLGYYWDEGFKEYALDGKNGAYEYIYREQFGNHKYVLYSYFGEEADDDSREEFDTFEDLWKHLTN